MSKLLKGNLKRILVTYVWKGHIVCSMKGIDPQNCCSTISWRWSLGIHGESSVWSTGGKHWGCPHELKILPFAIMTWISIETVFLFHSRTVWTDACRFIPHRLYAQAHFISQLGKAALLFCTHVLHYPSLPTYSDPRFHKPVLSISTGSPKGRYTLNMHQSMMKTKHTSPKLNEKSNLHLQPSLYILPMAII